MNEDVGASHLRRHCDLNRHTGGNDMYYVVSTSSGTKKIYDTLDEAYQAVSDLFDEEPIDEISPDGATVYYYATEEDADADETSQYADVVLVCVSEGPEMYDPEGW